MKIGFSLPTRGPITSPDNMAKLVERAEELGFDLISVSDHVVIPRAIDSTYPYSATGQWHGDASGDCLEQLTLLTYVAARTKKLRLLTSVMVLPQRPPVLTAKMLASLDVLSNGRLIYGVGAGWMREEFDALGAPEFDERGKVTDDYLRAFKELWTNEQPAYAGRIHAVSTTSRSRPSRFSGPIHPSGSAARVPPRSSVWHVLETPGTRSGATHVILWERSSR